MSLEFGGWCGGGWDVGGFCGEGDGGGAGGLGGWWVVAAGVGGRLGVGGGGVVVGVGGLGVVVMMVPVGLGWVWLRRLRREGRRVEDLEWVEELGRLVRMAGVTRLVELRMSGRCVVPLTF